MLGQGDYQVVVYDRGGVTPLGAFDAVSQLVLRWVRDDMGQATVVVPVAQGSVQSEFLNTLRAVRHELVVFRNGVRVWEGPITRINYTPDLVTVTAADVCWYLSRRALQRTYDWSADTRSAVDAVFGVLRDHYPVEGDPYNIGQYLLTVPTDEDARTAAVHYEFSKSVFELLDGYAARGGLDYVVRGRRIVVADTNTRLMVLPKMSDQDFSGTIQVVEYGNELATQWYVANNEGEYGSAQADTQWLDYYGEIDKITNLETEEGERVPSIAAMTSQAERAVSSAYPAPLDLLVPANVRVLPETPVEFTDLMPGAWVPIESYSTPRKLVQWQKIDAVTVNWSDSTDDVNVTMQAAPVRFVDPSS